MEQEFDFAVSGDTSIWIVTPLTEEASEWWAENVFDAFAYGNGFAVENRYISELCAGMIDDGMTVTKDGYSMQVSAKGELVLK